VPGAVAFKKSSPFCGLNGLLWIKRAEEAGCRVLEPPGPGVLTGDFLMASPSGLKEPEKISRVFFFVGVTHRVSH